MQPCTRLLSAFTLSAAMLFGAAVAEAQTAVKSAKSPQIYWIYTATVNPGRLDDFKQLVAEAVANTEKEPRTLEYQYSLTPDQKSIDIVERYVEFERRRHACERVQGEVRQALRGGRDGDTLRRLRPRERRGKGDPGGLQPGLHVPNRRLRSLGAARSYATSLALSLSGRRDGPHGYSRSHVALSQPASPTMEGRSLLRPVNQNS